LLWFFRVAEDARFFAGEEAEAIRGVVRVLMEGDSEESDEALRRLQSVFNRLGADSLDLVELVMEIEDFDSAD
jgi:acyl carrier protein